MQTNVRLYPHSCWALESGPALTLEDGLYDLLQYNALDGCYRKSPDGFHEPPPTWLPIHPSLLCPLVAAVLGSFSLLCD